MEEAAQETAHISWDVNDSLQTERLAMNIEEEN